MASVTGRISQIKQPRGGYVNPNLFTVSKLKTDKKLNLFENVVPNIVGLAVDYLTRYMTGTSPQEAFSVSLDGASLIRDNTTARDLLHSIRGLDEKAIIAACKLSGYDVVYRAGAAHYKPVNEINPDSKTIQNIERMVRRSLDFWDKYGPVVKSGFTFEGGYSFTVTAGDGDYLTSDTLWDFKVSKKDPTNVHTLQLLMYYIMGKRSIHPEFQNITKLGIFNPRLNNVYLLNVTDIDEEVIEDVTNDVICYGQH